MTAPKKPDYERLRRLADGGVSHLNLSDLAFLASVCDRAEWLEAERRRLLGQVPRRGR